MTAVRRATGGRWVRRAVPLALVAAAVGLVAAQHAVRAWESVVAARALGPVGAVSASAGSAITWFQFDPQRAVGLQITPECSAALVLVPVLLLAAGLGGRRRVPVLRLATGLALAVAVVVVGNVIRLGVIAVMIDHYGMATGYDLGHTVVGSLISLAFVAVALLALLGVVTSGRRATASRPDEPPC